MSVLGRCPFLEGGHFRKVSTLERCLFSKAGARDGLLSKGVSFRELPILERCLSSKGVRRGIRLVRCLFSKSVRFGELSILYRGNRIRFFHDASSARYKNRMPQS